MIESRYEVHECSAGDCGFRFPVAGGSAEPLTCPRCGARASFVTKYSSGGRQDRVDLPAHGPKVVALLDNIRSAYNVGAIFRTADGAGLDHLHLCGMTPTPKHRKVAKTALGAQDAVPWTYHPNGQIAALTLKEAGYCLWALEDSPGATWLFEVPRSQRAGLVLVVGNERAGVDPGLLAACDQIVRLPMLGEKESLNVEVAFGIAVYWVRFGPQPLKRSAARG